MTILDSATINYDMPCVYCAYNLRTLAGDANCPECGHAVRRTARLARLPASYLRQLPTGVTLYFVAALLQVFSDLYLLYALPPALFEWLYPLRHLGELLVQLVFWWAICLLASPRPCRDGSFRELPHARHLRLVAHASFGLALLVIFFKVAPGYIPLPWLPQVVFQACEGFAALLNLAFLFLLFSHVAILSIRFARPSLAREAARLAWVRPISAGLYFVGFQLFVKGFFPFFVSNSYVSDPIGGALLVLALLTYTWGMILLFRLRRVLLAVYRTQPPTPTSLTVLVPPLAMQLLVFLRKLPLFAHYHGLDHDPPASP